VRREPTFLIEYDASLTGIGLVISYLDPITSWTILAVSAICLPFDLKGDSGFQNTVEFLAVVVGLACIASKGYSGHSVIVQGDNTSSLSWCTSERFQPGPSRSCAVFFMAFATVTDLVIHRGIHIPGVRNVICDGLSRDKLPGDFGFDLSLHFNLVHHPSVSDVVHACNPLFQSDSEDLFLQRWHLAQRVANAAPLTGSC
jgi:hypothetical protein